MRIALRHEFCGTEALYLGKLMELQTVSVLSITDMNFIGGDQQGFSIFLSKHCGGLSYCEACKQHANCYVRFCKGNILSAINTRSG